MLQLSLIGNGQEFKRFVISSDVEFHIICIQETWLKPTLDFVLPGYVSIRKDRSDRQGGGFVIFIKAGLEYSTLSVEPNLELKAIEIWTGDFNAHNELWGSNKTDWTGVVVQTIMHEFNLVCLNDGHP